jgi:hypothetical protein
MNQQEKQTKAAMGTISHSSEPMKLRPGIQNASEHVDNWHSHMLLMGI